MTEEVPLRGLITGAVRVGNTVRRPAVPAADALLTYLETAGFTGAPRCLGRDAQGRSVLSWIDGWCPEPGEQRLVSVAAVGAVGALLRRYHDAVAGYEPPAATPFPEGPRARSPGQIVCHGDIAPRNTVFRDGMPVAFIDWDGAWISDPLWDVGYAIWQFAPLQDDDAVLACGWPRVPDRMARAAALADGYRLDRAARRALPAAIAPMIDQCAGSVEAKARAGEPAFAQLAAKGIPALMRREAGWAASQQPALRARLLAM